MFVNCFISQWSKRSKHGLFIFWPKKTLIWRSIVFYWPIVIQYDFKAKYWLISRKFSGMKFFSPKRLLNKSKAMRVCIHLINQSNCSISIRLLFLFCSQVVISRSFENRSYLIFSFSVNVSYHSYFVNVCVLTALSANAQITLK